ncbi:MAG: hypothetical protein NVS9B11_12600 [Candidatus Dormibacteraceae bacterium]
MARPSEKFVEYEANAKAMTWAGLQAMWAKVRADEDIDGWASGMAFQYLIVRAFELSGLTVEYPYDVPPGGKPLEQIDGIVYLDNLAFLIECKDMDKVDIECIAKMRNQLDRRPATTLGCIFVSGEFSAPALILAGLTSPLRVTLWQLDDIDEAIANKDFKQVLSEKYRNLCRFGLQDHSPHYKDLEVAP